MFNNNLTNLEKKALIITLAHLSPNINTKQQTIIFNKHLYKRVIIENLKTNQITRFNIDNHFKCDQTIKDLLIQVFDEYNFIPLDMYSNLDMLNNFSLLCNGISLLLKNHNSYTNATSTEITKLENKLQNISDKYTLNLIANTKMSNNEKTCFVVVRHLIDNIISGQIFNDGIELLDFINGTRLIKDLLCLNATLYDENTYFRFYQESN